MVNFLKQISIPGRLERTLSIGEYKRAHSWLNSLVSFGREIGGKGEKEDEWNADMSQLFIGQKFAAGRHSQIYRGVYKRMDVAIKLIKQPEEDEKLATLLERQFNAEVSLLFPLRHPNIITLVGACKKPPVFCILTEYMAGGSLRQHLHNQEPHSLPQEQVLRFSLDIAHGMKYLHSRGILHRDLKSDNLLLGEDLSVKVADFGISCLESQCGSGKGFASTYRWMAPEMIKEKHHSKKVDVYSFGIVFWELLSGLTPFHDLTPEQAAFAVSEKNARPPFPASCPKAFSNLISRCWSTHPDKRPQFEEIVSILESYKESSQQDPEIFSYYEPTQQQAHPNRFSGIPCFPSCIAVRRSEFLKT